jgi:hypothetical protein
MTKMRSIKKRKKKMFKFLTTNKNNTIKAILILETDRALSIKPPFSTDLEKEYINMAKPIGFDIALSFKYSDGAIWGKNVVCPNQGQEIMGYYYKKCSSYNQKPYIFCSNWDKYRRALDNVQKHFFEENFTIQNLDWLHSESQR